MTKKIINYILGALCIIGGIFLIIRPEQSISNAIYYLGILLLIIGICGGISCMINKSIIGVNFGTNSFILNIIIGIVLVIFKDSAISFVSTLLGIYLVVSGVYGLLLYSIALNKAYYKTSLIKNILYIVFGLIIATTPVLTAILSGVFFGIIVILIGIYIIFSYKDEAPKYKVRVK